MKTLTNFAVVLVGLSLLGASPTPEISSAVTPTPAPQKPVCEGPEFRQFDFWIGKWIVRTQDGKEAGTSEISPAATRCAIREQWKGASGVMGLSINYYDAGEGKWHQDWVGGDGSILHLRGGLQEGAMVLSGETKGAQGTVTNRITWTQLPDKKVKQEWATSSDHGKTWQVAFLGIYQPQG